ncbi:MAG: porin [Hyphomicrobiales bacterium]|nr:MAG: porin [Hyphomicrobiales bacterium]
MKSQFCLVLAVLAVPATAQAQEFGGGITLSYGMIDSDDDSTDISSTSIDGRFNLAFENGVDVALEVGTINIGIEDVPFDLTGDFVALDVGYRMSNGMTLGGYVEQLSVGIDVISDDLTLKSYGLSAGYEMDDVDLGVFVGRSKTDPDIGIDVKNFGLTAQYAAAPNLTFGGAYLNANLESGGADLDVSFTGIAATYAFTDAIVAFGGFSRSSIDIADVDIDTLGIGLGYDLSEMAGFATTVSLELARTTLSSGGFDSDVDTLRLGLTVPLGQKGSSLPINSVADSILNPRHGAINAALTSAF